MDDTLATSMAHNDFHPPVTIVIGKLGRIHSVSPPVVPVRMAMAMQTTVTVTATATATATVTTTSRIYHLTPRLHQRPIETMSG
jgi:hypothetical protein